MISLMAIPGGAQHRRQVASAAIGRRFGPNSVDNPSLQRIPKSPVEWYATLIRMAHRR